jgi:cbb3-type cytochrome oxidase cytochrome c subunit
MITKEDLAQAILEMKETQEKISLELRQSQAETDKQMKETDKRMKETQETLKKVSKLVGNISNNQGDIAEEFFYNSLSSTSKLAGINYDFVDKNTTRKRNGIEDEYDILMVNGKDIAIIETKYKAHSNDIEKLINKKYENFKKLYPEYKDYNHHLGLASFNINDEVKEIASKNNVILIQRKGDLIETILPSS